MKIDKCKKTERNKKMRVFDKKFENEKSNRRQHEKVIKIFNRN